MEKHPASAQGRADLGDRVNGADLVVGVGQADHQRVGTQRAENLVHRHQPRGVDRQPGDLVTLAFQPPADVEHRLVLGDAGDDVTPLGPRRRRAAQSQVNRLGRAGGENDLPRIAFEQRRRLPPSVLHQPCRSAAEDMTARRVAVNLPQAGQHGLDDSRIARRGRLVIEINGAQPIAPMPKKTFFFSRR